MKKNILLILIVIYFLYNSCKKEEKYSIPIDSSIIQDQYGRNLILHGLNTSSSAKSDSQRLPWIVESDVEREATEFGFNFVRFLIFWDRIEPEINVINYDYLNKVEERVNWYTSRGMYVMLDMHQDIYSSVFGGDGAPEWAVHTNGNVINTDNSGPWWMKYIDPAVSTAFLNFWEYTAYKDLQDNYILCWKKVAERFKNNSYVIGYDLMNEPFGGDLINTVSGQFEKTYLADFYRRLIPAIRNIDNNKYIFFEPKSVGVTFGWASGIPKINDSRKGDKKLVYSPHLYPFGLHEGQNYTALDKINIEQWKSERSKDLQLQGTPMLVGEFGLSPDNDGYDRYLTDVLKIFDDFRSNWSYWSNDQGGWSPLNGDRSETPILQHLIRPYPRAVAGKIIAYNYNTDSKKFWVKFKSNSDIKLPTELFIPNRHYPNGWELHVSGALKWKKEWDNSKQLLRFYTEDDNKEITLTIINL